ncbi:hypothetical protein D3C86_1469790 [compost metagenome]
MGQAELGQGFGPQQRSAFTLGEKRRLAPGRHGEQTTRGFATLDRIGGVHVDAEGTAVDLRSAQLDQFNQVFFQRQLRHCGFQGDHRLEGVGAGRVEIDTGLHDMLQGKWVCRYVSPSTGLHK